MTQLQESVREPDLPSECDEQSRSRRVVEEGEIDLVRVFVLNDAPGKVTGVQKIGVEADLAWVGVRRSQPANDADPDPTRDHAPVEAAHSECGTNLRAFCRRPALDPVVASDGSGIRRREESERCERCDEVFLETIHLRSQQDAAASMSRLQKRANPCGGAAVPVS